MVTEPLTIDRNVSDEEVIERLKDKLPEILVEDAKQIATLLGELGYPNTKEFPKEKIKELSDSEIDSVFVAEIKDKIIAFAHLHIAKILHEPGKLDRVMAIVVSKDYLRAWCRKKTNGFS